MPPKILIMNVKGALAILICVIFSFIAIQTEVTSWQQTVIKGCHLEFINESLIAKLQMPLSNL